MKNMLILLCLLLFSGLGVFAQQEPISALYWNSYSYYNPAYTAWNSDVYANIQARDQWTTTDGNPFTVWAAAETRFKEKNGIGLNLLYDEIGLFKFYRGNLNYSRRFIFSEEHVLAIGASLGFKMASFDYENVVVNNPNDPAIPSQEQSSATYDLKAGIMYKLHIFNFGFGIMNLDQSEFKFNDNAVYPLYLHYSVLSSIDFSVTESVMLQPRILFFWNEKSDVFSNYSLGINAIISHKFILGAHVRKDNTASLIGGFLWKEKWKIEYAFEPVNESNSLESGSHEFSLSFLLNRK